MVIVIAVFLVANKLFRKEKKPDFNALFEKHLKDWIMQNYYLVYEEFDEEGKGKPNKRYCKMVIDHSNVVERRKLASHMKSNKESGVFVVLPYLDEMGTIKNEFDFMLNAATFTRQQLYLDAEGTPDLAKIILKFSGRIDDSFKSIGIETTPYPSQGTISVSFDKVEKNEENARRLVDIVEFVKTMVLALA